MTDPKKADVDFIHEILIARDSAVMPREYRRRPPAFE